MSKQLELNLNGSKLDPTKCYLKLFHGRKSPEEELDDWGTQGPILGPLDYVHTTYGETVHVMADEENYDVDLHVVEGLLYYDKVYYGDWSVTTLANIQSQLDKVEQVDEAKAKI